jgi:hypothetical protein
MLTNLGGIPRSLYVTPNVVNTLTKFYTVDFPGRVALQSVYGAGIISADTSVIISDGVTDHLLFSSVRFTIGENLLIEWDHGIWLEENYSLSYLTDTADAVGLSWTISEYTHGI